MHHYRVPDPATVNHSELIHLRDLTDEFNAALQESFDRANDRKNDAFRVMTEEEAVTLDGMCASMDDSNDSTDLLIGLQSQDILADIAERLDRPLVQTAVPAAMARPEVADLFKKYDLPALEKLSRKAIKPPTP